MTPGYVLAVLAGDPNLSRADLEDFASFMGEEAGRDFMAQVDAIRGSG
ncbi:hypothetical protein [Nonomuraea sp. GTA35]